ncbi:MAG: hypothetical protein C0404_05950 [Verrucomicrobia bacterium]|nr:hypothetical protein [Verrucomicrobiota bacterium]
MTTATNNVQHASAHAALVIFKDDQLAGCSLIDLSTDLQPVAKELAWRAAAAAPHRAGEALELNLRPGGTGNLSLEALAADHTPVAGIELPITGLYLIAQSLAASLQIQKPYKYGVYPIRADDPLIANWEKEQALDDDFEIMSSSEPEWTIPGDFTGGLPEQSTMRLDTLPEPTWRRCLFTRAAYGAFLEAAAQEKEVERHWAGLGDTRLSAGACYSIIEELVPIPGAARQAAIETRGNEWQKFYSSIQGDRLVAYLHLHPPAIGEQTIMAAPSTDDHIVFMHIERIARRPCCFPIALFGSRPSKPGADLCVYAYNEGQLRMIQMEVSNEQP